MGDLTCSSPEGTAVLAHGNRKANDRRDTSNSGASIMVPTLHQSGIELKD